MRDLRKEIADQLRFSEFAKTKATDAELRKFFNENRDRFGRTQVRASHILLKVEPNASKTDKDKVKQKLEAIRKEIVNDRISFAAAANKYSEDPANAGGAGGDLDYFTLDSGFVDEFADVAFKLKKGEVSQPVETPFGYHLIQVTDRREGQAAGLRPEQGVHSPGLRHGAPEGDRRRGAEDREDRCEADAEGLLPLGTRRHCGGSRPARDRPGRWRSGRAEALSEVGRSIGDHRSETSRRPCSCRSVKRR